MNMHYKTLGLLTSLICLVGCNDFLEQSPDDRAIIDEAEKVGELLVLAYPTANHQAFCYAMSDNATDKVSSRRKDDSNKNAYYWEDFTLTNQDTPDHFWNGCYSAIKQANHALAVIEPLIKNGIVPEEYAPFYGEALLCRAYSHFMLVNLWSPQYNPSTADTDLGIPYVVEPETVVLKDYKRGTVAEVYNKIEQDILTGIKYLDEYTYSGNKMRLHWNNKAASTFAARFYSMKGDFQKVLDYTNQVITDEPTSILRQLNTTYKNMNITDAVPLWTRSTQSCNLLVTPQYSNWFSNLYGNYQYGMSFPLYDYVFKGRIQYREVHKEPFVAVKENWQDVNDDGTPDYLGYLDTWYWDAYGSSDLHQN